VGGAERRPLIFRFIFLSARRAKARLAARQKQVRHLLRFFVFALPIKRIFAIMNLRSTIRLLILMAVFGISLSNRVERTKGGHLSLIN